VLVLRPGGLVSLTPEVHARHHASIAARVEKARQARDKRRAGGDAAALLRQHLGTGHGVRMLSGPPRTLAQLHALHVRLHAQEAAS